MQKKHLVVKAVAIYSKAGATKSYCYVSHERNSLHASKRKCICSGYGTHLTGELCAKVGVDPVVADAETDLLVMLEYEQQYVSLKRPSLIPTLNYQHLLAEPEEREKGGGGGRG